MVCASAEAMEQAKCLGELGETPSLVVRRTFIEFVGAGEAAGGLTAAGAMGRRVSSDPGLRDSFWDEEEEGNAEFELQGFSDDSDRADSDGALDAGGDELPESCCGREDEANLPSSRTTPSTAPSEQGSEEVPAATAAAPCEATVRGDWSALDRLVCENRRLQEENRLLRENARLQAENRMLAQGLMPQASREAVAAERQGSKAKAASAAFANRRGPADEPAAFDAVPPPEPGARLTTVMLRNLPNNYSRAMVLAMLDDEGFAGLYDFVYLPIDFKSRACLGYAFVNMVTAEAAAGLWQRFDGYSRWMLPSRKVCNVCWSGPHQGLEAHVERYRNSPVMHPSVPDEYKPVVFAEGLRVVFPPPLKAPRAPRVRNHKER